MAERLGHGVIAATARSRDVPMAEHKGGRYALEGMSQASQASDQSKPLQRSEV